MRLCCTACVFSVLFGGRILILFARILYFTALTPQTFFARQNLASIRTQDRRLATDGVPQRLHRVLVHWPWVSVYSQGMATMATMATPN